MSPLQRLSPSLIIPAGVPFTLLTVIIYVILLRQDRSPLWIRHNTGVRIQNHAPTEVKRQGPFRYILGVSTGHAGSSFAQAVLEDPYGCPFSLSAKFEKQVRGEQQWDLPQDGTSWCQRVNSKLLPLLERKRPVNGTYVDMGHYHNRGRTIECLADALQDDVAFVRIRRNRYKIAQSFLHSTNNHSRIETPCMRHSQGRGHPGHASCPFDRAGEPNLVVQNATLWGSFSPFQKFLWYADEMEHRWYTLQRDYPDATYFDITWEQPDELFLGLSLIRSTLKCRPIQNKPQNDRNHVNHRASKWNCSDFVRQDLEYRRLMGYDDDEVLQSILFGPHAQHVDFEDCMDSASELKQAIGGDTTSKWVLPPS